MEFRTLPSYHNSSVLFGKHANVVPSLEGRLILHQTEAILSRVALA